MRRRRIFPHLGWLLLSLMVTAGIVGPTTTWLKPGLIRWNHLRQLTSPNPGPRERALNFVIAHARGDKLLLDGAIERLSVADTKNFVQIANALEYAGQWRRPTIPPRPWLRWLGLLAADKDPQSRIAAAQRLGESTDLLDRADAQELLSTLTSDPADDVRFNGLIAAAAAVGAGSDSRELRMMLWRATEDASPAVAREAWIFVGLRRPRRPVDPAPLSSRPMIGEAAVWAAAMTMTGDLRLVGDLLDDEDSEPTARAMAVYGLAVSPTAAPAAEILRRWLTYRPPALTPGTQAILWRTILAAPLDPDGRRPDAIDELLLKIAIVPESASRPAAPRDQSAGSVAVPTTRPATGAAPATGPAPLSREALLRPLLAAAQFRHGLATEAGLPRLIEGDPLLAAAAMAGTPRDKFVLRIPDEAPDVLHLLAFSSTKDPQPAQVYKLFTSDVPAIRDHACLLASERLTPEQNAALIRDGFKDFDDRAKMSAAVLAGLTGLEPDLLKQKMTDEDIWMVQQIMRLGMWMQGKLPDVEGALPGLLTRDDMPRTTLMLAMLHRKHPQALDYLLNPRGEPWPGLADLLTYQAWWPVLRHYLPDDAPPLWPWGDRALVQFQLDTLRDWRVLNAPPRSP
ncbi:MAG: hypothetical protein NTW19_04985 [Planctomycetota bacterium]|nr:hypothetical protein [Planctomycetota bacterium]